MTEQDDYHGRLKRSAETLACPIGGDGGSGGLTSPRANGSLLLRHKLYGRQREQDEDSLSALVQQLVEVENADSFSATKGLLMIWAYRDDVDLTGSLGTFLSRERGVLSENCTRAVDGARVHTMQLSYLTRDDAHSWIKEFLRSEGQRSTTL
jgi:hypothetical protein